MSKDIELSARSERTNSFCAVDPHSELLTAFERKNVSKFRTILERGLSDKSVDVNHWYGDPYYGTLLDICCREAGNHQFVQVLLSHGADPNRINKIRKKCAIHVALEYSDYETIRALLEDERTDVNLPDNADNSALHLACKLNDPRLIELLLSDRINKISDVNRTNRKGQTPLHVAITKDNKDVIRTLLLKRTDVDLDRIKTASGKTGRELINEKYPSGEFEKLMMQRRLPASRNQNGAAETDDCTQTTDLFSYLYRRDVGLFINAITNNRLICVDDLSNGHNGSYTLLQCACEYGLCDAVQCLLDKGVNPNKCCAANNQTPIMIAAYHGYINIVCSLVQNKATSYRPVNGETVLHSVVNGMSFCRDLLGCWHEERNYSEVLKCLLSKVGDGRININEKDVKGNTALHYAAKVDDSEIILLLLRHGAYVGERNVLGEPAFVNIPCKIFRRYLDECISTNDKLPREDGYEIIFKYNFLVPPKSFYYVPTYKVETRADVLGSNCKAGSTYSIEDDVIELPPSSVECETDPLNRMTELPEWKPFLKHPVLASFVNLKWYTIRQYFYLNAVFYIAFWLLLTFYILTVYSNSPKSIEDHSKTNFSDKNEKDHSNSTGNEFQMMTWLITIVLAAILTIREFVQFVVSPYKYVVSPENWLEVGLIVVTFLILCRSDTHDTRQISAIAILLSWIELVLLIGRHPLLSTNIEMFKTVCRNFLKLLTWYSILILAFALSFYIMFKDDKFDDGDQNFFRSPTISIFKSVIMTTGEFDASAIPFQQHPGTSHVLFILFVFLIAIVLFNLLNGLAVNDTRSIRADAELVSYVSRVKLISYFESIMSSGKRIPSSMDDVRTVLRCCCIPLTTRSNRCPDPYKHPSAVSYSLDRRVNLFPYLLADNQVHVLPNQECRVRFVNSKTHTPREDRSVSCLGDCKSWYIDPTVIQQAKVILAEHTNDQDGDKDMKHLLQEYKAQLENYKQRLDSANKESEENRQMLTEILSTLRNNTT